MEFSKYVAAGMVVGLSAWSFHSWNTERKVRKGSYYEKSLNLLKGYKPASEIFGEPIKAARIELEDEFNFLNKKEAKLVIPVSGSKGHGNLYTWSTKPENSSDWQVDQLDIEIIKPSSRRWTFYKREHQTEAKTS